MRILIAYEKGEPDYYAIPDDEALGRVVMKLIEERYAAGYYVDSDQAEEVALVESALKSRNPQAALQFLRSRSEYEYERIAVVHTKEV